MKPISEIIAKMRQRAAALRAAAQPPAEPPSFALAPEAEPAPLPRTRLSIYEEALWAISQTQSRSPAVREIALQAQTALEEGRRHA